MRLILPSDTRIQPRLSALAAAGIASIMLLGAAFRVHRGEVSTVPGPLALGSPTGFVVSGGWTKAPIQPRWECLTSELGAPPLLAALGRAAGRVNRTPRGLPRHPGDGRDGAHRR